MEKRTPLVDEHLLAMQSMEEIGTDDFFYTRLKARMLAHREGGQREHSQQGWSFPLKPVWIVSTLVLLLVVNGFMLSQQFKSKETRSASATTSPIQNFASSYDQTISSSY